MNEAGGEIKTAESGNCKHAQLAWSEIVWLMGKIAVNALAGIEKQKIDSRWWWQASRGAAQRVR